MTTSIVRKEVLLPSQQTRRVRLLRMFSGAYWYWLLFFIAGIGLLFFLLKI